MVVLADHRCEMGMVFQADGYNHDIKVQTMPSGRSFCEHDMMKFGGIERCITRFECMHALQKLSLTPEEKVLFQCMMLFTVGEKLPTHGARLEPLQMLHNFHQWSGHLCVVFGGLRYLCVCVVFTCLRYLCVLSLSVSGICVCGH